MPAQLLEAFSRFGWARLMSPGLGGHERPGLYSDGISKVPANSGIPLLFREIFKNVFLPYRDPETLKAFPKIINERKPEAWAYGFGGMQIL